MRIPRHADAMVELLAKALIALPDLEALAETGRAPDDLTWIRELAAAARRAMDRMG
jgi:hypothetical protein